MIDAIQSRVRGGPQTDALWDFFVGHWLWWRMWLQGLIAVTPLFAGWVLLRYVSPFWAVTGSVFIAQAVYCRDWGVIPDRGEQS